jgi:hypothetical protein
VAHTNPTGKCGIKHSYVRDGGEGGSNLVGAIWSYIIDNVAPPSRVRYSKPCIGKLAGWKNPVDNGLWRRYNARDWNSDIDETVNRGGGRKGSHPVDLARPARVSVEQSQPLHACWLLTGCRSGMHTCCYAPSSRVASLVNKMLQMGSGALSMAPVHLPRSTGQGQSWKYKYGASSSSP